MSSLRELEDYMEILVDEENEEFDMIKKKKKLRFKIYFKNRKKQKKN